MTMHVSPRWVAGLKPKLEAIMKKVIGRGSLIGRRRIVSEMLEMTSSLP